MVRDRKKHVPNVQQVESKQLVLNFRAEKDVGGRSHALNEGHMCSHVCACLGV